MRIHRSRGSSRSSKVSKRSRRTGHSSQSQFVGGRRRTKTRRTRRTRFSRAMLAKFYRAVRRLRGASRKVGLGRVRNTGSNGRLPSSSLASIGNGHKLVGYAARAYLTMRAAAARVGITWGVTDSYRSYAAQVSVAKRKGLYSKGGLAAVPGTSNHGWGRALDLALSSRAYQWLKSNAARFGFRTIPREKWHWEYR